MAEQKDTPGARGRSRGAEGLPQAFWSVALFSGVVNLLMLAGPLYMLQIYDRVLASRSVPTLIALSLFLVGAYAFQGVLDVIRTRLVVRVGELARPSSRQPRCTSAVVRLSVAGPRIPAKPDSRSATSTRSGHS